MHARKKILQHTLYGIWLSFSPKTMSYYWETVVWVRAQFMFHARTKNLSSRTML